MDQENKPRKYQCLTPCKRIEAPKATTKVQAAI